MLTSFFFPSFPPLSLPLLLSLSPSLSLSLPLSPSLSPPLSLSPSPSPVSASQSSGMNSQQSDMFGGDILSEETAFVKAYDESKF